MSRRWKIVDRGTVPEHANEIEYLCTRCGKDALLPISGLAIAQIDSGVVFDPGIHDMPTVIECPYCRHRYELVA